MRWAGLMVSRVGDSNLHRPGLSWRGMGKGGQIVLARILGLHKAILLSLGSLMPQEGKWPLRATGKQQCQGWMLFQPRLLQNDVPGMGMRQREAKSPVRPNLCSGG